MKMSKILKSYQESWLWLPETPFFFLYFTILVKKNVRTIGL